MSQQYCVNELCVQGSQQNNYTCAVPISSLTAGNCNSVSASQLTYIKTFLTSDSQHQLLARMCCGLNGCQASNQAINPCSTTDSNYACVTGIVVNQPYVACRDLFFGDGSNFCTFSFPGTWTPTACASPSAAAPIPTSGAAVATAPASGPASVSASAPAPGSSSAPSSSNNGGLPIAAIAGGVAGVVVVVAAIVGVIWFRRSKKPANTTPPAQRPSMNNPSMIELVPAQNSNPYLHQGAPNTMSEYTKGTYAPAVANQSPGYATNRYEPAAYQSSAPVSQPTAYYAPSTGYSDSGAPNPSVYAPSTSKHSAYRVPTQTQAYSQAPSQTYSQAPSQTYSQQQPGSSNAAASVKYVAIASIDTKNPQQISLSLGDTILVQPPFVNGFAQGFNQRTGRSGFVSENCLRAVDVAPQATHDDGLPSYVR
ncbi:uncharacterized protein BJ171DRAFT_521436 [Polychytrium aggregatum]|uniref:uncharacterized protein n=1 Tax=Polychytrium aggregatum TaxID=110093 RepID=UPI0022FE836E|nr:uncharacterized protein BJ171DRAFT_521436 [Polychytrium aggregatum]KAI9197182.1 hypothetical protein BJ171DRAFT_521436 [Polychytrium aggregatum]